jgi:tetratricopeptide (TPR) repeat protein
MHDRIPTAFISFAATELTNNGLSGPKLVEITSAYAADFGVDIPHARYPFDAPNKRTALLDNLLMFSPKQQYQIIRELCDRLNANGDIAQLVTLKTKLFREYRDFADQDNLTAIHETQIIEARHWLADYPEAKKLFDEALQKHSHGVFQRNTLDDLRLALEILVRQLFGNHKTLENQISTIGQYVKDRGGSPQLANMFEKLVDYYTKYQNTYIKHDDAVITAEIEFVFELTSSFVKHFLRLKSAKS